MSVSYSDLCNSLNCTILINRLIYTITECINYWRERGHLIFMKPSATLERPSGSWRHYIDGILPKEYMEHIINVECMSIFIRPTVFILVTQYDLGSGQWSIFRLYECMRWAMWNHFGKILWAHLYHFYQDESAFMMDLEFSHVWIFAVLTKRIQSPQKIQLWQRLMWMWIGNMNYVLSLFLCNFSAIWNTVLY